MFRRKKRFNLKKTLILLICFSIVIPLGIYFAKNTFSSSKNQNDPWIVARVDDGSEKYLTKDALIEDIQNKSTLITMEVQLEQTLTLNDSWGNWDIFKKLQTVHFYGRGIYSVDLSILDNKNVIIDNGKKTLTLHLNKPVVKDIVIDEEKTIYESPDMGTLRFGDVELTTGQYNSVLTNIKSNMKDKLCEDVNMVKAEDQSAESIKSLIQSICDIDSQNINIDFN